MSNARPCAHDAKSAELVSLVVMGYNQQEFIEATVRAAFAQTYRPLEIVLSDDGSSDKTFAIMQQLAAEYDGPHRVRLNRNARNLGFVGHLNKIFEICDGVLIVYNPGDDISEPDRAQELYAAFRDTRPLLVHSDASNMNPDGTLNGFVTSRQADIEAMDLTTMARAMSLGVGATCAWNPDIVRLFGPVQYKATYDDLIFFFRARLLDRLVHVPKPLVRYRYQVGMSNRYEHDWKVRIRHETKLLTVADDTYRQRLLDCRRVTPEKTDVIAALEAGLDRIAFKQRLYGEPGKAWPECLVSRQKFDAGLSVLNRLRKLTFRGWREEQKRAGIGPRSKRTVSRAAHAHTLQR